MARRSWAVVAADGVFPEIPFVVWETDQTLVPRTAMLPIHVTRERGILFFADAQGQAICADEEGSKLHALTSS